MKSTQIPRRGPWCPPRGSLIADGEARAYTQGDQKEVSPRRKRERTTEARRTRRKENENLSLGERGRCARDPIEPPPITISVAVTPSSSHASTRRDGLVNNPGSNGRVIPPCSGSGLTIASAPRDFSAPTGVGLVRFTILIPRLRRYATPRTRPRRLARRMVRQRWSTSKNLTKAPVLQRRFHFSRHSPHAIPHREVVIQIVSVGIAAPTRSGKGISQGASCLPPLRVDNYTYD